MSRQREKRVVGPESVRVLELGHPWIIADAFTKKWTTGKPGDVIELTDQQGRFLATALLDPDDRIIARVLSRQQVVLDRSWLAKQLKGALQLRRHAFLETSNAYRVVNGEGDLLPGLTVDRYGKFLMLQIYCEAWRPYLKLITSLLEELLQPDGIYEKSRPRNTRELEAKSDQKRYGRLLSGKPAPPLLKVEENGLSFLVSLEEGLNTGLFLDQRKNRAELMQRVAGKRFLNLFSYTGAFSVAAAAAGASGVTSVDFSPHYMERAKDNFKLNGLKPEKYRFITGECRKTLQDLAAKKELFDIILMDPPSFSTAGKGSFSTRGGTSDLTAAAIPLLADGGLLICSSNHQKTDLAEYLKELRRGALQAGSNLRVIAQTGQPEDFPYPVTFPEGRYLKYVVCAKG